MSKTNKIGVFQLAMITVAYVASIRTVAIMAKFGLSSIFYYFAGAVLFLIPTALVSAELSTMFPSKGGIYKWVNEAIPGPYGFLSIWIQFLISVLCLPVLLMFLASSTTYIFNSSMCGNRLYIFIFVIIVTLVNVISSSRGMKITGWMSTAGVLFGLFIPTISLLFLAAYWIIKGYPINTGISVQNIFPDLTSIRNLSFLVGLILSFAGMESSGSHILDMKNPLNYYKSILIAGFIIPSIGIGAFAISIILPNKDISIISGLMETFRIILSKFGLGYFVPVITVSLVGGMIVTVSSSIIGPSKGLLGSSRGGELPPLFCRQNKHGMPVNLFIFQAVLIIFISTFILIFPDINSTYLMIIDSATFIYMLMYITMFVTGIMHRYKNQNLPRPFKIPGGNYGIWIVSIIGIISSIFSIVLSMLPEPGISLYQNIEYRSVSILCGIVLIGIGYFIYKKRKPEWVNREIQ